MRCTRMNENVARLTLNDGSMREVRGTAAEVDAFCKEFKQIEANLALLPAVTAAQTVVQQAGGLLHNETPLDIPSVFDEAEPVSNGFKTVADLAAQSSGRETPLETPSSFLEPSDRSGTLLPPQVASNEQETALPLPKL